MADLRRSTQRFHDHGHHFELDGWRLLSLPGHPRLAGGTRYTLFGDVWAAERREFTGRDAGQRHDHRHLAGP